jgi:hypothetical protein
MCATARCSSGGLMAIRFSVIASGPPSQAQGLVRHGVLWPWRTACHMAVTDAAGQHWTQVFTLGRLHALACEKVVWLDSAINAAWPLFHYGSNAGRASLRRAMPGSVRPDQCNVQAHQEIPVIPIRKRRQGIHFVSSGRASTSCSIMQHPHITYWPQSAASDPGPGSG